MIDCFWSLYNIQKEIRVDGLRTIQVQALLPSLHQAEPAIWMVWQEGTERWVKASDVLAALGEKSDLRSLPPKPPGLDLMGPKVFHKAYADRMPGEPQAEKSDEITGSIDMRMMPRYLHKFPMHITYQGLSFANRTVNISVGGIRLETALPNEMSGKAISVRLQNGSESLNLNCFVIRQTTRPVDRLLLMNCDNMEVLRRWILSGVRDTEAA